MRITAQLIDALTGAHLWADRFDGSLEDVFELQDKVASASPGSSSRHCKRPRSRRSAERPTTDLTAYDLYLRALRALCPVTKERILEALRLARAGDRDAIRITAPRWPGRRICHLQLVTDGWAEDPETHRRKGVDLARQALAGGAENDPGILANAAFVLGYFGEDIGAVIALVDRALDAQPELRPRLVYRAAVSGCGPANPISRSSMSRPSLRLSPRERIGTPLCW